MKTKSILILMIIGVVIVGCNKEETMGPLLKPKANFDVEIKIIDDQEVISLINTSENGISYYWEIGDKMNSTQINPSLTRAIGDNIYDDIIVTLKAIGDNGEFDAIKKPISKVRAFKDFAITKMSDETRSMIVDSDETRTVLVVCLGPISEVNGWSPENHLLPEKPFYKKVELPFLYGLYDWKRIVLKDEGWYIRLSTKHIGQKTPVYLKEFKFNTFDYKTSQVAKGLYKFTLADDDMSIEIYFEYTFSSK